MIRFRIKHGRLRTASSAKLRQLLSQLVQLLRQHVDLLLQSDRGAAQSEFEPCSLLSLS